MRGAHLGRGADPIGLIFDGGFPARAAGLPAPARLGQRTAGLFAHWARSGHCDVERLSRCLLGRIGLPLEAPIAQVCLCAAAALVRWGGHAYHSADHHAEVTTNVMILAELAAREAKPLDRQLLSVLLAAALSHDLEYEAGGKRPAFAAEEKSASLLDAMAGRCGVDAATREVLHALVLATEPSLRSWLRALVDGAGEPDNPAGRPRQLSLIAGNPALIAAASLLSDADLLSSAGLTVAWHDVQVGRLECELGRPITAEEDDRFFSQLVGPSFLHPAGQYFAPNLQVIRSSPNLRRRRGPEQSLPASLGDQRPRGTTGL